VPQIFRSIPSADGLPEPVRVAINYVFEALTERIDMVQIECMTESRETLAEVRLIRDMTREGWAGIIEQLRPEIPTVREKLPTLSEAVNDERWKREGRMISDFKRALRGGASTGVAKALQYAVVALALWALHDLLPRARIIPTTGESSISTPGK
jgi:hypothetical protein